VRTLAIVGSCVDDPKSVSLLMELAPGSLRSLLNHKPAQVAVAP
jgi:hypothetical protein